MKLKIITFLSILFLMYTLTVSAQVTLKIGYINMNKAINESNEGKRSKQFLETQFEQTKRALDQKKFTIDTKENELAESLMLSEATKQAKRQEIESLKKELVEEAKKTQNAFRQDESRHTQKILQDLVSVVKTVATAENYDAIIEFNIRQTIIYSKHDISDITDKVILEYNKLQTLK